MDDMMWLLVAGVLGVVVAMVIVFVICFCYYRRHNPPDQLLDYEEVPQVTDASRADVKQLRKHSWTQRMRTSLITTKPIKFERPGERKYTSEAVQPNLYSQTSLNKQLGVNAARLNTADGSSVQPSHQRSQEDEVANTQDHESEVDQHNLGKIQFTIKYDFQEMTLTLKIMRAINLPAKDFSGTSDPYVKIMLLPDKKHKLQTNIKRKNLNPRWNELFAFEGFPYSKLQNRTLYMQVLDYDRFSRDDPIGEVAIPLSDLDLAVGLTMWKALQPCKGSSGKLGELLISMCYQPTVGRLTIVIMKARELKAKDIIGTSDPYVKIWMCHDGKKVEKKKTSIKERNLNPVFNESFIFDVPYEKLRQTTLLISVMDHDRLGRNELIGSILLGTKSGPMEVKHWNEMFSKSRQPVAQWHILKDFG